MQGVAMVPATVTFCGATTRDGAPCRRAVKPGFTRCKLHGGDSPAARAKAEEFLLAARVKSAGVLDRIVESYNATACDKCGRGDDVHAVIRAAIAVLDRTGFGPRATLTVERGSREATMPWVRWLTGDELALIDHLCEQAERRMEAGEAPAGQGLHVVAKFKEGEVLDEQG
jgi:hypothetical protein